MACTAHESLPSEGTGHSTQGVLLERNTLHTTR